MVGFCELVKKSVNGLAGVNNPVLSGGPEKKHSLKVLYSLIHYTTGNFKNDLLCIRALSNELWNNLGGKSTSY